MQLLNQYSFLLLASVTIVGLAVLLFRDGIRSNDIVAIGALVAGFLLAYALFRPGPSSVAEIKDLDAIIGAGNPVLVELQSPY